MARPSLKFRLAAASLLQELRDGERGVLSLDAGGRSRDDDAIKAQTKETSPRRKRHGASAKKPPGQLRAP
jgi:hypothetical protein